MTSWDAPGGSPLEDLRAAVEKWEHDEFEPTPPYVVHPATHAKACRLLGRPEGSELTNADLEEAARIEYDALSPDQQRAVRVAMWNAMAGRFW